MMKNKIILLLIWCLFVAEASAQTVPVNVQKTPGTNAVTANIVVGTGKTLTATGSGVISATALSSTAGITGVIPIANLATGTPTGAKFIRDDGTLQIPSSTTPGGSTTQLQYNNASAFAGISGATSNGTAVTFTANNLIATSPKIITDLSDTNGNELFKFTATASAVNELTYANAATGNPPTFTASGSDSNISIFLTPKGTGITQLGGGLRVLKSGSAISFGGDETLIIQNNGTTSGNSNVLNVAGSTSGAAGYWMGDTASQFQGAIYYDNATDSLQLYANNAVRVVVSTAGAIRFNNYGVGTLATDSSGNITAGSGIHGTVTNNNAAAGDVGEYVSSTIATGSAVSLTTATTANVTSVSLTAGDWDVDGVVDYVANVATAIQYMKQGSSSTTATLGAQDTFSTVILGASVVTDPANGIPTTRFSLASTTTVYLVANASFTVSTLSAYGTIRARRVR